MALAFAYPIVAITIQWLGGSAIDFGGQEVIAASPRRRMLGQPVSEPGASDTSAQETVLAVSEPDMATGKSVVASGTKQSDIQAKVSEQIGEGDSNRMPELSYGDRVCV